MTAPDPAFHIVVRRPDKLPVPSVPSTKLDGSTNQITLKTIRDICRVPTKYVFTSDGNSSISDETTLAYYISLTPDNARKLAPVTEAEKHDAKKDDHVAGTIPNIVIECISTSPSKADHGTPLPQSTLQKDLKDLLGLTGKPVEGLAAHDMSATIGKLAALEEGSWAAQASGAVYKEAEELTEQHWESILSNNRILYGYHWTANNGFVKAPKRAFTIRRPIEPIGSKAADTANAPGKGVNGKKLANPAAKPGNEAHTASTTGEGVKGNQTVKANPPGVGTVKEHQNTIPGIPRFYIHDDSRVNITEIKNGFQQSLAKQGFSSESIDANLAVAALNVSLSKSEDHSYDKLKVTSQNTTSLIVSYIFPRVVLDLDPDTLQLSDQCVADVMTVKNTNDVDEFYKQYGTVFATHLTLGGCLQSTKHISENEVQNMSAVKDEIRWAAGASFASPKASAGVNYANTKSTKNADGTQTIERSAHLTWEARGGDTVLCSNPPLWAYTVKDYRYWRVMEQSELKAMHQLISEVDKASSDRLTTPETSNNLDNRKDRSDIQNLISRMTLIVTNKNKTDTGLSLIVSTWVHDTENPVAFNKWLTDVAKKDGDMKVAANKPWESLTVSQRTYYGIYLQLVKKVSLVPVSKPSQIPSTDTQAHTG